MPAATLVDKTESGPTYADEHRLDSSNRYRGQQLSHTATIAAALALEL